MAGVLTLSRALIAGGTVLWEPPDRPRLRVLPIHAEALRSDARDIREILRRAVVFRAQIASWQGSVIPLLFLPEAPAPRSGACISCGANSSQWRCLCCLVAIFIALDDLVALRQAMSDGDSAG